jgi:replicative DNA helicase
VIQSTARQVCKARGIDNPADAGVLWGFTLPQLSNAEHLNVLRKTIEDQGIEYVAIDPFYLALMAANVDVDPSNMFKMGPILADVARVCIDAGCTPHIAHHFVKKREDPFSAPELGDLAYSGIGQFVRQWMLVAPRERFDAEIGLFKLHFCYGGSAGHCGEFMVDIEVGKLDPDADRRKWNVVIASPSQERTAIEDARKAEHDRKAREREQEKAIRITVEENAMQAEALTLFRAQPDHRLTERQLRTAANWGKPKAERIIYLLCQNRAIRSVTIATVIGNGATREFPGYELVTPEGGANV